MFVHTEQGIAIPKQECSSVLGRAPRKALCVKKATKKGSGKAKAKKDTGNVKAPKKSAPAAIAVHEHVSASTTPTGSPPHTPSSPSYPPSPTYERESWWDSFHVLSRRVNDASASIKDLKDQVKRLEEEREKDGAAGSVFGKRD